MITKWDIISRLDTKTHEIHYTLVMDGTEKEARTVVKKLKKYILSAKMADRPFVYAFRLLPDLDEVTLDKIRTAVREVVGQTEKVNNFVPDNGVNPLFNTILSSTETPTSPKPQMDMADNSREIQIDLEDATIISANRIGAISDQSPASDPQQEQQLRAPQEMPSTPTAEVNAPTIVPLDETKVDLPDITPDKETKISFKFHFGIGGKKKKEKPLAKPKAQKAKEILPEQKPEPISPEDEKMPSLDMNTFLAQTMGSEPVAAKEAPLPVENPRPSAQAQPIAQEAPQPAPQQEPALPPQAQPAPQPVAEPRQPVPQPVAEPIAQETAQPAPLPKEETVQPAPQQAVKPQPAKREKLSFKDKVAKAKPVEPAPQPVADDGIPEIRVQVRPFNFEDESKKEAKPQGIEADLTTAQPATIRQEVKPAPQAQPMQEQPAEVALRPLAEQPAPAQPISAPEEKAVNTPTQPVSQAQVVPAPQAQPAPQQVQPQPEQVQAQPEANAKPNDVESAGEPLNFSLEDMFLAETKYDMFVDVDANNTQPNNQTLPDSADKKSKNNGGTK